STPAETQQPRAPVVGFGALGSVRTRTSATPVTAAPAAKPMVLPRARFFALFPASRPVWSQAVASLDLMPLSQCWSMVPLLPSPRPPIPPPATSPVTPTPSAPSPSSAAFAKRMLLAGGSQAAGLEDLLRALEVEGRGAVGRGCRWLRQ